MQFKSISELRTEYRDNPDYAIQDAIPDVVAELQANPDYSGYSQEELEKIAKSVLNKRNGLTMNAHYAKVIPNDGRPVGSKWSEYSYEEILAMEANGVNIPKEFTDWAHSMQDSDATNYVVDDAEVEGANGLESMDQLTDDPNDAIQAKAKAYTKKCEQEQNKLNNEIANLAPKAEKAEAIQNQSKTEQEKGMKELTEMAKRWNELDKKIQNGEALTANETNEYAELNKNLNGANADLRKKMSDTVDSLNGIVDAIDEINDNISSDIDLSTETIELANTLAGVQKGYNPTSIKTKMVFMAVGELADMMYGAKGQSVARDTVDAGINLQTLANDSQVEVNKNSSLYDFALEYGTSLNDQLSEVDRLLGENPNKGDNTVVAKAGEKAADKAEEDAMASATATGDSETVENPEAEVTTGTPDKSVSTKATEGNNVQTPVETKAMQAATATPQPAPASKPSSSDNKTEAQSLDEQGEGAIDDARSTNPKIESKGIEAETETKEAEKTQKAAKAQAKELKKREKATNKESKQVNALLKDNNNNASALSEEMAAESEVMAVEAITNPEQAQASADKIAIIGDKIQAFGIESNEEATEFTEETEESQEEAEKSQKTNEKSQKYNSKVEKAISYIDQIAAMGLQKGMSTIGTGAVMTVQGQTMVAAGTALLSNPFTAAVGTALITAGTTTANIGLGAINVGGILSTASFYTLAATKVTKMTIAACNGDLKGVFKNLGAFATVCATSVASCAATMAVGAATMGVAGPVGTAIASQAVAVPFDTIAYGANMALSNENIQGKGETVTTNVQNVSTQPAQNPTAQTATEQPVADQSANPSAVQPVAAQAVSASAVQPAVSESAETETPSEEDAAVAEEEAETPELNAAQQAHADMKANGASKREIAKAMREKSKAASAQVKPIPKELKMQQIISEAISNKAASTTEKVLAENESVRNEYDELSDKIEEKPEEVEQGDEEKLEQLKTKLQRNGKAAQDKLLSYDAQLYSIQAKSNAYPVIANDAQMWGEETIKSGFDLLGIEYDQTGSVTAQKQAVLPAIFYGIDKLLGTITVNQGVDTVQDSNAAIENLDAVQAQITSFISSNAANKKDVEDLTFAKAQNVAEASGEGQASEGEESAEGENVNETTQTQNASTTLDSTGEETKNDEIESAKDNVSTSASESSQTTEAAAAQSAIPAGSFAGFQARTASNNSNSEEPIVVAADENSSKSKGNDNKKEEVTEDSVDTKDGEATAKENEKAGENVDKENKDKTKASKDAQKEGKDLEKSDKQLQKEVKNAQKELKEIEEKILKLTEESMDAIAEIEALNEQNAQASAPAATPAQPAAGGAVQPMMANASMSAGAPTGGAAPVSAAPVAQQNTVASAPAATNSAAAFDISGGQTQKLSDKVTANVAQITALQSRSTKTTKKLQKNLKTQQKRAEKAQKAAEKEQKQNEKLDKALTYVDYAATATKLTGVVFNGIGSAQVTAGTAMIAVGTAMMVYPFTAAAGAAMVSAGTTLETTGSSNIGVGNILNMVGTYTGMAVKVTKITIAACQGNLMGVLTNAAALGMSCLGGFPVAENATQAITAASQAGQQLAQNALQQANMQIMQNAGQQMSQQLLQNSGSQLLEAAGNNMIVQTTEEATKAALGNAAKEALAAGSKKALTKAAFGAITKGAMDTLAPMAMGAAGAMMNKPQTPEEQRRELHLTNRKKTAQVIKAINRRKGSSQYGRQQGR